MTSRATKCECEEGPAPGERWFFCERHQCRKTKEWRLLCQTKPAYRKAWEEGQGPGQNLPARAETRQSPIDVLVRTVREYILRRRPAYALDAGVEKALATIGARDWSAIERTLKTCIECVHYRPIRCQLRVDSCEQRGRWLEDLIRQPCKMECHQCHEAQPDSGGD